MTLQRRPITRRDRSEEFASYVPVRPAPARMAAAADFQSVPAAAAAARLAKIHERKVQSIRDSARGEECTVRIPGVCTGNPEHTIWSHAPFKAAGKGMGIKALDACGAYCCTSCDAVVDGQAKPPPGMDRSQVLLCWFYGHMKSLVRLAQKGLIK